MVSVWHLREVKSLHNYVETVEKECLGGTSANALPMGSTSASFWC